MLNARPAMQPPLMLADEQLEYWAECYRALPRLAARGVTFEQFLGATPQARECSRLLLQLLVRERLEARGAAPYALSSKEQQVLRKALGRSVRVIDNGRLVEKLRHHRHPRGKFRDFLPAREG
jgi:hypothetical protein